MVLAAREAGRTLMVGQSYRLRERFRAIKNIVEQGDLGELCLVQSEQWWKRRSRGGRWCRKTCEQWPQTAGRVSKQRAKKLRQAFTWSPFLPMVQPDAPQAASCRRFGGTKPWYRRS